MKKVYIPLAIVAVISLSSCHKSRTCTCTITDSAGTPTETQVDTWERASKHEAASRCVSRTETYSSAAGYTKTYDCKLS
jgi:hypothetical protein